MSHSPRLLIVTGLPASGKTTLARWLAARYGAAFLAKDRIKEPLLDVLGAADRAASRALSDASFAVLFSLAAEQLALGSGVIIEGNFRPREHAAPLSRVCAGLAADTPRLQVLCRTPLSVRVERLRARAHDRDRHPGHGDLMLLDEAAETALDDFIQWSGGRVLYTGMDSPEWPSLLERLDQFWKGD